jgi:hypothetical protein
MTRDDIIRMAQESSGVEFPASMDGVKIGMSIEHLECFAALVAAAERERFKWDGIHSCHPHCDRPACLAVRRAREDEREMCAKVLDEMAAKDKLSNYYVVAALAIRERGAP